MEEQQDKKSRACDDEDDYEEEGSDGGGSSSSGSSSEEDLLSDEEGEGQALLQLEAALAHNPYSFQDYVEYIRVLRKGGMLEKLREARAAMSSKFPLSPGMWQEWTNDEIRLISRREEILAIIDKRWAFMSRPIHAMAALLHPFYKKPALFNDRNLLKGKDEYIGRMCEEDEELDIDAEIASYENNLGASFTRAVVLRPEATKFSLTWWQSYGRQGLPKLTRIALRVLSQDCSAGACERNWSAYSLIHTKIRNRLSTAQLERLVYCRANMKLVRDYRALGTPKQIDPSKLLVSEASAEETEQQQQQLVRNEQEEIIRMLHRELESVDRRVTRSRARVLSLPLVGRDADPEVSRRETIRRGKLPIRTPRRRANEAVPLIEPMEDDDPGQQSMMAEPEYDEEGNVVVDGDLLSSAESSSSSSDEEF